MRRALSLLQPACIVANITRMQLRGKSTRPLQLHVEGIAIVVFLRPRRQVTHATPNMPSKPCQHAAVRVHRTQTRNSNRGLSAHAAFKIALHAQYQGATMLALRPFGSTTVKGSAAVQSSPAARCRFGVSNENRLTDHRTSDHHLLFHHHRDRSPHLPRCGACPWLPAVGCLSVCSAERTACREILAHKSRFPSNNKPAFSNGSR